MPQSDKPSKSASQPQTALDPLAKMKETFEQFLSSFHAQDAHPGAALIKPLELDAQKLQGLQSEFIERATKLWNDSLSDSIQLKDRRFSSEAWAQQPSSKFVAAMYLLNGEFLQKMVHAVKADEKTQTRTLNCK